MKKTIGILFILLAVQLTVNILFWNKDSKQSISLRQRGWATNVTFEIADGVARFREDRNRMPTSIAEMRPRYLPETDVLFPSQAKEIVGLANVVLKDNLEALDLSGVIQIYQSETDDSFFVILSPVFFGSKNIPIRFWHPSKNTFDVLPLEKVKTLISSYKAG